MADRMDGNPAFREYREKAKREHLPIYGNFELTARCNLDCKMCYVHKTDAADIRNKELTTAEWKEIFDAAISAGMMRALLTGGECLLRDDFEELYRYLYDRGMLLAVNTNGLLLTEEKIAFLDRYRPERLQISLYGSCDDGYERVTGHREFDKIIRTLDLLEAYHIRPLIALTVSRYMEEDFVGLLRLLNQRKLPYTCAYGLIESREDRKIEDYALSVEDKIKLKKIRRALTGGRPHTPCIPAPLPGCPDGEPVHGMPCNAGNIAFSVTWEGKMALCLSFPEISADLRENGFDACWRYIRQRADEVLQPADCVGCVYRSHCEFCPAKRFDGLFGGRCRKELCAETVKLYEAGMFSLDEKTPDGESCP